MTDAIRDNGQKTHGLYQARRLLNEWGSLAIDGRSTLGRAIARWTDAIVADLGGEEAISAQQATVIEMAVRTKILIDGVDSYLLTPRRNRYRWSPGFGRTRFTISLKSIHLSRASSLKRSIVPEGKRGLKRRAPGPFCVLRRAQDRALCIHRLTAAT